MQQNYGVLRVVRVRLPANATANLQDRYPSGLLPEERLVHLLSRTSTTVGRALNNDIILMDPTVSREHARLDLDASGWRITNLTEQNTVRVNGRPVPSGGSLPMQPQDILILGSTMLQLIAPNLSQPLHTISDADPQLDAVTDRLPPLKRAVKPGYSTSVLSDAPAQWKSQGEEREAQAAPPAVPAQSPVGSQHTDFSKLTPLPVQPEPELVAQAWDDEEEESLLGAGVTMQFALPHGMGARTRWLIAGAAIAFLAASATITLIINF